jgi:hypothetical protein
MTRLGRKPKGAELVSALAGSPHAKIRLKLFLQTLADELSVLEACEQLGIGESRFHEQRTAWLHSSIEHLEPRAAGRPRKISEPSAAELELQALRTRIRELEARAAAAEAQADLLRTLPRIAARVAAPKKTLPR